MSKTPTINFVPLSEEQYINTLHKKTQIYLHHTVSSANPHGVRAWWENTPPRIGTAFIIGGTPFSSGQWYDGEILQVFNSKKSAYHLGLTSKHLLPAGKLAKSNSYLNFCSIGVELCSWGGLTYKNGKYYNVVGQPVDASTVYELPQEYRGFRFFQSYTDAQIDSLKQLLQRMGEVHNIPLEYKGDRIFDICTDALSGEPGVWSHTSVRPDKSDIYPYPKLITMLKSL